ncbi:MAG: four helix bundle protein [Candidatus Aminicenantales bacterium]
MNTPTNNHPSSFLEKLECWQQAKRLAVQTYQVSTYGNLSQDLVLRDEIRKSALAIASQIASGKERGTASGFIAHLGAARAAAAELRTQIHISREIGYLSEGDVLDLEDRINRVSAMISGLIRSLRSRRKEGRPDPD